MKVYLVCGLPGSSRHKVAKEIVDKYTFSRFYRIKDFYLCETGYDFPMSANSILTTWTKLFSAVRYAFGYEAIVIEASGLTEFARTFVINFFPIMGIRPNDFHLVFCNDSIKKCAERSKINRDNFDSKVEDMEIPTYKEMMEHNWDSLSIYGDKPEDLIQMYNIQYLNNSLKEEENDSNDIDSNNDDSDAFGFCSGFDFSD